MEEISIDTDFIRLDQFLKYVAEAQSGADAKLMIRDGIVLVNGQVETRRGKKLRPGDLVQVEARQYQIK